jgi:hypothetical protein
VPAPDDLNASRSDTLLKPDLDNLGLANETSPPQNAKPKKEPQMEFLCPNGHRLFGSTNLAGHPGECPDCGAQFRIPTHEEISLAQEPTPEPHVSQGNGRSTSIPGPPPRREPRAPPSQDLAEQAWEEEVMPSTVWSVAAGTALTNQPVATLFAKLWTTRPKGTRVEVQLRDGEAIVIEQFVATLSQPSHGVFSVRTPDNTHTLITIAWDTIARILVRGLLELPK